MMQVLSRVRQGQQVLLTLQLVARQPVQLSAQQHAIRNADAIVRPAVSRKLHRECAAVHCDERPCRAVRAWLACTAPCEGCPCWREDHGLLLCCSARTASLQPVPLWLHDVVRWVMCVMC